MKAALAPYVLALLLAPAAHAASVSHVALPDDVVPSAYRLEITPDAAAGRLSGHVDIDVDVRRATRRIVLNGAELTIDRATLDDAPSAATVREDKREQTLAFDWGRAIPAGRHVLHVDYRGPVRQQATGLFALREPGTDRPPMLFTQFENSDARRFLPCWDEPARKATFTLGATVPAGLMAVGNMPITEDAPLPDGSGRRHVRFATSPKMSSYLLFFALGDFERVHRDVNGVDVGVVVRRGEGAHAGFALDAAAQLLPWFDEWFGVRYPLPKLDLLAGPGANPGFGAMENWGAIFFFEQDLLVDPAVSGERERRDIYETVAHEIAHQWFGNLVTMAWWDDLWLNEGFATWMEAKASAALHPEWDLGPDALESRERAMSTDQRAGTHPVVMPIRDVLQADAAFDAITYAKGAAVVRELEAVVGEGRFREGVREYMRRHAYGNTAFDDFFAALDRAAEHPVSTIAHDLVRQPGVPQVDLLSARCEGGRTVATLSQGRFRDDDGARAGAVPTWHVPVRLAVVGEDVDHGNPATTFLVAGPKPQRVTVPGCGPLLVNAGQTGYYRTRYDAATLRALGERMDRLGVADQMGLLQDTAAMARAGRLPMGVWLDLLARVPAGAAPGVLSLEVSQLESLRRLAQDTPSAAPLRAFALGRLRPVLERTAATQDVELGLLRDEALSLASRLDDEAVVATARADFARWLKDPAVLDAAARRTTLAIVARHATAEDWDLLRRLAREAPTHLERMHLVELLGTPARDDLARRALDLALADEVPATLASDLVQHVAQEHPTLAFDTVATRWDAYGPRFDTAGESLVAPHLLDRARSLDDVRRLEAFARAHVPRHARQEVEKVEATITAEARARQQRGPALQAWLAARGVQGAGAASAAPAR